MEETKKYLEKLKEEDYIHWDSVVNDPYVVGQDTYISALPFVILIIILIALGVIFL